MFGHVRGHVKYTSVAEQIGSRSLEITTFVTTRFFSSAYQEWEKIIKSYPSLIEVFKVFRERENDDCDETKYEALIFKILFT